jgi:hypothetical protein
MSYTQQQLKDLEVQAIEDHRRGLLTREQLLRIVHRLDRISAVSVHNHRALTYENV